MSDTEQTPSPRSSSQRARGSASTSGSRARTSAPACAADGSRRSSRAPSGIPWWALLAAAVGVSPRWSPSSRARTTSIRVAVNTVLFALLALGLNVVVGWAGLLDLGFVAFYGFGAYPYAMLSSTQFGLHWPGACSRSRS